MTAVEPHRTIPRFPYPLCWQLLRKTLPQPLYLPLFQNKRLKVPLVSAHTQRWGRGVLPAAASLICEVGLSPASRASTRHSPMSFGRNVCSAPFSNPFRMIVCVMYRGWGLGSAAADACCRARRACALSRTEAISVNAVEPFESFSAALSFLTSHQSRVTPGRQLGPPVA